MQLDPSNKWFDHKHHYCGLKYVAFLAIDGPQFCNINGLKISSMHEIAVLCDKDAEKNKSE